MNGLHRYQFRRALGFIAALTVPVVSVKANPVAPDETPLTFMIYIPITLAILLEAICVSLILRRWRRPRCFILWLLAMHLLTYPLFLGILWLLYGVRPAFAMTLGEAAIVLIEGGLICLMCRYLGAGKSPLPVPSISKSLFASLIGNLCSAVSFPLLMILCAWVASSIAARNVN
jgi:hypothetical protein